MGKIRPTHWALALVVALLVACGPGRPKPMTAFEGRLSDWSREILADSPELAAQAGVTEDAAGGPYADRLDDRSPIAFEARRSAALRRYAELRALDTGRLSDADRLTYDVLRAQFSNAAAGAAFDYGEFTPLGGVKPYVLNQLDSAFLTLPSFLEERHDIRSAADAEAYIARLRAVAVAIDQETERARADAAMGVRPPGFIMDATFLALQTVLQQPVSAQPYMVGFRRKLDALAAAEANPAGRGEIERANLAFLARAEIIVRDNIVPAHQRAVAFIRADRANASEHASVTRLPRGADLYAAALRIETTTDLFTLEQFAAWGGVLQREFLTGLGHRLPRVYA